jgi:hypothetical protein
MLNRSSDTEIDAEGFDEIVSRYDNSWNPDYKKAIETLLTDFLKDKNKDEYQLTLLSISYQDDFLIEMIKNDKNITIIKQDD